jgi:hypothetical protein
MPAYPPVPLAVHIFEDKLTNATDPDMDKAAVDPACIAKPVEDVMEDTAAPIELEPET